MNSEPTRVWLLRTQEIHRAPAVRGGVEVDHRARKQTAACIAGAILLLLLCVLARLARVPAPRAVSALLSAEQVALAPAAVETRRSPLPVLAGPPPASPPIGAPAAAWNGRWGIAAPSAPTWLETRPKDWRRLPATRQEQRESVLPTGDGM